MVVNGGGRWWAVVVGTNIRIPAAHCRMPDDVRHAFLLLLLLPLVGGGGSAELLMGEVDSYDGADAAANMRRWCRGFLLTSTRARVRARLGLCWCFDCAISQLPVEMAASARNRLICKLVCARVCLNGS